MAPESAERIHALLGSSDLEQTWTVKATQRQPALISPAFDPLPLGSMMPTGRLLDQLRIQAAELSGHLDEFWPDVADSTWIGGQAESWERGPYWLHKSANCRVSIARLAGNKGNWAKPVTTVIDRLDCPWQPR